jgi:asparagine synthase (glutamine-hydrolysing)
LDDFRKSNIREIYIEPHSEIKSIFTNNEISRSLDPQSLDQVFTFWTTLPEKTIFNNINELPPAHYMVVSEEGISTHCYWHLSFLNNEQRIDNKTDDLVDEVSETFMDAVKIRLRADVTVGSYQRGGLDSSGITETISNNFNNELRSFGIRFYRVQENL